MVGEGQHQYFVPVPSLAAIANGVLGRAARGDQALLVAGDGQVTVIGHATHSL